MVDPENINFLDVACLFKIAPDTTMERFGTVINSSFFDAANITGTLKQKGLIDFTSNYAEQNSIVVTEAGKKLKEDLEAKSAGPLDNLDDEVLRQMSGGKRFPAELQGTLNIRPKDLAFRIYKLFKQNLLAYEIKNGNVELMLTEQGFLRAKPQPMVQMPVQKQAQQAAQTPQAPQAEKAALNEPGMDMRDAAVEEMIMPTKKKRGKKLIIVVVLIIIIVVVALIILAKAGKLPFSLPFNVSNI